MSGLEGSWKDARTQRLVKRYKEHYKESYVSTLETGCLAFTSLIMSYLIFGSSSSEERGPLWMDRVVGVLFLLGALLYSTSARLFSLSEDSWVRVLRKGNRWLFLGLSFLPGLYFAHRYETIIMSAYLLIHITTTAYFLYKRYKEFEVVPFVAGLGLSLILGLITPSIRFFFGLFGSGWFVRTLQSFFGGLSDLGLAIAFFLKLPEKYLPANMLCGLKVVKYMMFLTNWETWFILMVFTTWRNLGAGTRTAVEAYKGTLETNQKDEKNRASTSKEEDVLKAR